MGDTRYNISNISPFFLVFFLIASDDLPTQGYADYKHQVLYLAEVPDPTEGDEGATSPMPVAT